MKHITSAQTFSLRESLAVPLKGLGGLEVHVFLFNLLSVYLSISFL
jgi:hypothetical protein